MEIVGIAENGVDVLAEVAFGIERFGLFSGLIQPPNLFSLFPSLQTAINNSMADYSAFPSSPPPEPMQTKPFEAIYYEKKEKFSCAICLDDITENGSYTIRCNHPFHDHCIRHWYEQKQTCPTCRASLLSEQRRPPEAERVLGGSVNRSWRPRYPWLSSFSLRSSSQM